MQRPSILLIHGPATGAWIWELWRRHLLALGWQVNVLDLRGHGLSMPADLASVTLEDYVSDIASVAPQIGAADGVFPIIGGWSMGALLTLMYAATEVKPPALLLISPMPPVEAVGRAPIEVVRTFAGDVLGPEAFGLLPADDDRPGPASPELEALELERLLQLAAGERESGIAYRQALRGVSIPSSAIECPVLTVHTPTERQAATAIAAHLEGGAVEVPVEGRWSIVWHEPAVIEAAAAVDVWLNEKLIESPEG